MVSVYLEWYLNTFGTRVVIPPLPFPLKAHRAEYKNNRNNKLAITDR